MPASVLDIAENRLYSGRVTSNLLQPLLPPPVPDHEMISVIGEGSYGQVWLARSTLGTMRAVKVVWRAKFDSVRPYEREFSGIKRFEPVSRSHEGLVDILQVGRNDAEEFFYYVMELADDASTDEKYRPRTLRSEIDALGRIPAVECVHLFLTLAAALAHMHRLGLIHRDVKPSNIVIVDGVAKLADIGLVAEMNESRSFVGTEGYIPPEGPNSPQGDIYSLGKALYEASTGMDRMKFPTLPSAGEGGLAALSSLVDLNAVCMKACAPEIAERYQSAAEMLADLATLQSGRSVREVHRTAERLHLARRLGLAAGALAVLAAGIGGLAMWRAVTERESRKHTETLLHRAEIAETKAQERLYGQSVALARAECLSTQTGRRFRALDALRHAASVRPGDAALRSQAFTALAIPDFREVRRWPALRNDADLPLAQAFAPKLDRYASATPEGRIVIRSTGSDPSVQALPIEATQPIWIKFSADAQWLLSFHPSNEIIVWDLTANTLKLRILATIGAKTFQQAYFREHKPEIFMLMDESILVAPINGEPVSVIPLPSKCDLLTGEHQGRTLACSRYGGAISLIHLDTAKLEQSFVPSEGSFSLNLSPNARMAAVSNDGRVYFHDLTGHGDPVSQLPGRQGAVPFLEFDPESEICFASSWDGTTRLIDVASHNLIGVFSDGVLAMQFRTDERRLGINPDNTLIEAEWAGMKACRSMRLAKPQGYLDFNATTFSADGRWIMATGGIGFEIYDAQTLELRGSIASSPTRFCLLPLSDGVLYLAQTNGLHRCAIQLNSESPPVCDEPVPLAPGDIWSLAATPNGATVVAASYQRIYLKRSDSEFLPLMVSPPDFRTLALSPDGRWLATRGKRLLVFDLEAADPTHPVADYSGAGFASAAFTVDSTSIVASTPVGILCRSLATGEVVWRSPVTSVGGHVACSPDGRLIAAQILPNTIALLRSTDGSLIANLAHPQEGVIAALAFSPDSQRLMVTESNRVARIWDFAILRPQLAALQLDWSDEVITK